MNQNTTGSAGTLLAQAYINRLRGWEFCPFSPFFAHFSTFTKIPQVPSFQAHSPVTGGSTSHANYGGNRDWYIRSGSSAGMDILQDTGGFVGVGVATPSYDLHVSNDLFGRLLYGG